MATEEVSSPADEPALAGVHLDENGGGNEFRELLETPYVFMRDDASLFVKMEAGGELEVLLRKLMAYRAWQQMRHQPAQRPCCSPATALRCWCSVVCVPINIRASIADWKLGNCPVMFGIPLYGVGGTDRNGVC